MHPGGKSAWGVLSLKEGPMWGTKKLDMQQAAAPEPI